MIPYEEFRYGASTNWRFKPSSDNVKQTLRQQSLDYLTSLMLKKDETEKTVTMNFPTEDLITVTVLTRNTDLYGNRNSQDNHTYLFRMSDYLDHYKIFERFPPSELIKEVV